MMSEASSPVGPYDNADPEGLQLIQTLREDDVLLGRGVRASSFTGNRRYLALVDTRREEYNRLSSKKQKAVIAYNIYFEIQKRKGRFLETVGNTEGAGPWRIASEPIAMEKIKQALREKQGPTAKGSEHDSHRPPNNKEKNIIYSIKDGLEKKGDGKNDRGTQTLTMPWKSGTTGSVSDTIESSERQKEVGTFAEEKAEVQDFSPSTGELNLPKFVDAHEAIEGASTTLEERAAALSDSFMTCCIPGSHRKKRARLSLDRDSIAFLIDKMILDLENIPQHRKEAFMEAKQKCLPEEFSDSRLERFLRCEEMNTKRAAQRFVNYWEARRAVFGSEKYLLPITLNEALRDDQVALQVGFFRLLPLPDLFGRQIIMVDPHRHTGDGYGTASLLRATWYVIEVAAQACTEIDSGCINLGWHKDETIWNFDRVLFSRCCYFELYCWPIKFVSRHICGLHRSFVIKAEKPVDCSLMDKEAHSRIILHDSQGDELIEALTEYGIERHMLPVEMGGTAKLDALPYLRLPEASLKIPPLPQERNLISTGKHIPQTYYSFPV